MNKYDIAILGGGASGMAAALAAAARRPGTGICILEKQERVGRKLLSTGNGRCNLTNISVSKQYYQGDSTFAMNVIDRCGPENVMDFFDALGLPCFPDSEGRVYPMCEQASAVLDTLRFALKANGIDEICSFDCRSVSRQGDGFKIRSADSAVYSKRLIICTGGKAAPKLGGSGSGLDILKAFGHRITPTHPALTAIDTRGDFLKGLKGQRLKGTVSLISGGKTLRSEKGEIMFTETGLSGICVMQLSSLAYEKLREKQAPELSLRLTDKSPEDVYDMLLERCERLSGREAGDFLTGIISKRIGQAMCKLAGIYPLTIPACEMTVKQLKALAGLLTDWRFDITGIKTYDEAQVMAGGADTRDFDPATMASRLIPGLFAAGEVLNVNGDCGGYNLQWAWAGGINAGNSAADSLTEAWTV